MREPRTFDELFSFYQDRVKLYYSAVQAENELPTEILFELNAAFDHISRYYIYRQSEEEVVQKAYSHLKRACLDVFKLTLRDTLDKAAELEKLDISLIDNGHYEKELKTLKHSIKLKALEARKMEGDPMTAEADLGGSSICLMASRIRRMSPASAGFLSACRSGLGEEERSLALDKIFDCFRPSFRACWSHYHEVG